MDTSKKVGHRESVDNIVDWCRASIQELSCGAQDRAIWKQIIKEMSDFIRRWAHGLSWIVMWWNASDVQ